MAAAFWMGRNGLGVVVEGLPIPGQTLRVVFPPGLKADVQWTRDGVPIQGATGPTYFVIAPDNGHVLDVDFTNVHYSLGGIGVGTGLPMFTSAPVVLGTPTVGVAMLYQPGTVLGTPPLTRSHEWLLDGTVVSTGGYTPVTGDVGHSIAVRESVINLLSALPVQSISAALVIGAAAGANALLLEDGTPLLLEDGTPFLLEV